MALADRAIGSAATRTASASSAGLYSLALTAGSADAFDAFGVFDVFARRFAANTVGENPETLISRPTSPTSARRAVL
jgi:hypothetical protein